jgi:hypothetical protein
MASLTTRVVRNARRRGVTVYDRKDWGSRSQARYAWRRIFRRAKSPADTVVQHITVTHPGPIKEGMRTLEDIGNDRFGTGVSYNFGVHMHTGEVGVGQPLDAKGAHTLNDKGVPGYSFDQNLVARAIAVIGMPATPLSDKAEEAIAKLLAAMMDEGAITRSFDYDPHSKFAFKDCPCDPTRNRMGAIRNRAFDLLKKKV